MTRIILKKPLFWERPIYPGQQIILLAGCSSAEPVSSFDLHREDKKTD
jgi:hypothetical protein